MKKLLIFLLACLAINTYAAIYENTQNGEKIYSDVPENNSKPVALPSSSPNISLPSTPAASSITTSITTTSNAPSQDGSYYKTFAITDPVSEMNYQNQRDIPVTLKIEPPLQE